MIQETSMFKCIGELYTRFIPAVDFRFRRRETETYPKVAINQPNQPTQLWKSLTQFTTTILLLAAAKVSLADFFYFISVVDGGFPDPSLLGKEGDIENHLRD